MRPTDRIQETFGWRGFPYALFYEARYGLRFELGGDLDMSTARFAQAFDRARAVADRLFQASNRLTVVLSVIDAERRSRRASAALEALAAMGFSGPFSAFERVARNDPAYIAEFGQDLCDYWTMADFDRSRPAMDALFWAAVAREMPIRPKAPAIDRLVLADFDRGVALHVYDDRGMDVAATARAPLEPLYNAFSSWLLDHDRAQMDRVFSGGVS